MKPGDYARQLSRKFDSSPSSENSLGLPAEADQSLQSDHVLDSIEQHLYHGDYDIARKYIESYLNAHSGSFSPHLARVAMILISIETPYDQKFRLPETEISPEDRSIAYQNSLGLARLNYDAIQANRGREGESLLIGTFNEAVFYSTTLRALSRGETGLISAIPAPNSIEKSSEEALENNERDGVDFIVNYDGRIVPIQIKTSYDRNEKPPYSSDIMVVNMRKLAQRSGLKGTFQLMRQYEHEAKTGETPKSIERIQENLEHDIRQHIQNRVYASNGRFLIYDKN